MGITAYKKTITETETPRQIERRVFSTVTAELEVLQRDFDHIVDKGKKLEFLANGFREVLWKNQQVWMAMQSDLADSGNALSPDLRASLISLAIWVQRHTQKVMEGSELAGPLLEINLSIVRGLDGIQPESEA